MEVVLCCDCDKPATKLYKDDPYCNGCINNILEERRHIQGYRERPTKDRKNPKVRFNDRD